MLRCVMSFCKGDHFFLSSVSKEWNREYLGEFKQDTITNKYAVSSPLRLDLAYQNGFVIHSRDVHSLLFSALQTDSVDEMADSLISMGFAMEVFEWMGNERRFSKLEEIIRNIKNSETSADLSDFKFEFVDCKFDVVEDFFKCSVNRGDIEMLEFLAERCDVFVPSALSCAVTSKILNTTDVLAFMLGFEIDYGHIKNAILAALCDGRDDVLTFFSERGYEPSMDMMVNVIQSWSVEGISHLFAHTSYDERYMKKAFRLAIMAGCESIVEYLTTSFFTHENGLLEEMADFARQMNAHPMLEYIEELIDYYQE